MKKKLNFIYLSKNIEKIENEAFDKNQIEILDNIKIEYDIDYYKNDMWNNFAKYYNDNNKKAGDYKLENNKWKWYPL